MIRTLKKRYVGFRLTSDHVHSRHEVSTLLLNELNVSWRDDEKMIRVRMLGYDVEKGLGILLCDHKSVDKIRDVFDNIQDESHGTTTFQVLGVSGTIKALKRKFLGEMG